MFVRLLLIAGIVAVGWYLFRQWTRPASTQKDADKSPGQPPEPSPTMVCCEECGVHAPANNGVRYQDRFFCTPQHLQDWLRRQGQ